jgi:hypothetical protein
MIIFPKEAVHVKKATLKGGDALPWERVVNVGEEKFVKSSNFKRSVFFWMVSKRSQ